MPARLYSLFLTGFSFPRRLPNDKANFRFVVTVRYLAPRDKLVSEVAVMPALDAYWECDTRKRNEPHYVRRAGEAAFDLERIDPWDRLVLHVRAVALHSLQFKVFDVDRRDAWDRIQELLGDFARVILRRGRERLPVLPPAIEPAEDSLGSVAEDLEAWVLQKLAAQRDRVLFRGSHFFADPNEPVATPIRGVGVAGEYTIDFEVRAA